METTQKQQTITLTTEQIKALVDPNNIGHDGEKWSASLWVPYYDEEEDEWSKVLVCASGRCRVHIYGDGWNEPQDIEYDDHECDEVWVEDFYPQEGGVTNAAEIGRYLV